MMRTALEPSLYAKARLPLEQAETLPRWCYTTQEFYDEEINRIFRKTWNFVGREDEIASPGSFLAVNLFGESIIMVRDRAGKIHAFANTCRHRGTRLLSGSGRCPATFACRRSSGAGRNLARHPHPSLRQPHMRFGRFPVNPSTREWTASSHGARSR
jgi:hypothetical protein